MKKHVLFFFLAIAFVFGASVSPTCAAEKQTPLQERSIQLTEKQKAELKEIHKDILEEKKELIRKYVEFEVITEATGDKIIERYEEHYRMVEQNGFMMPHHHFHNKRWKNKQME